jgi:hypothetical protein
MSVGVIRSHRGDRDARVHSRQEAWVLVRRPVVRDLEHVGTHRRSRIEKILLRNCLQVAGQ